MHRYLLLFVVGLAHVTSTLLVAAEVDYSLITLTHTLRDHDNSIAALAISADGKTVASASYDKTVRLWDVATGKLKIKLWGFESAAKNVCFSPDGRYLATAFKNKKIQLWNIPASKEARMLNGPSEARALAFSPDSKLLVSSGYDKSIRLWDVATGKERAVMEGHRKRVRELMFAPDGGQLVSRGWDDLFVWDRAGKQVANFRGLVSSAIFSADGKTLLFAAGHQMKRWETSGRGKQDAVVGKGLSPSGPTSSSPGFLSPDGRFLATIQKDLVGVDLGRAVVPGGKKRCRVILMDLASGREKTVVERRGSRNWYNSIVFSPNGKTMALWHADRTITLVDTQTGKFQAYLSGGGTGRFRAFAFTPDGKTLAVADVSSLMLWQVP